MPRNCCSSNRCLASNSSIHSSLASIDGTFCSEAKKTACRQFAKNDTTFGTFKTRFSCVDKARQCQSSNFFVSQIFVSAIAFLFLGFLTPDFPTNLLCTGIFVGTFRFFLKLRSKWHILWVSDFFSTSKRQSHHQWLPRKGKIHTKKMVGSLPYLKKRPQAHLRENHCWSYISFSTAWLLEEIMSMTKITREAKSGRVSKHTRTPPSAKA